MKRVLNWIARRQRSRHGTESALDTARAHMQQAARSLAQQKQEAAFVDGRRSTPLSIQGRITGRYWNTEQGDT